MTTTPPHHKQLISIVVPCYNEGDILCQFYSTTASLPLFGDDGLYDYECVFVNDGSSDDTRSILEELCAGNSRAKAIHLASNKGHQIALTAGMDYAAGDIIVSIDADMQDPPEVIADLVAKIEEGYDIVHTQRRTRNGESRFKRYTASLFYRLIHSFSSTEIIVDSGDFRAFTRQVLVVLQAFREQHRFLRGIFPLLGFNQCVVLYDRAPRAKGETKYTLVKMTLLALNGIVNFTSMPLLFILLLGVLLWIPGLIYALYALWEFMHGGSVVPGWTSLTLLIVFLFGVAIFCNGLIGLYINKMFQTLQYRPLYWVAGSDNIDITKRVDGDSALRELNINARSMRYSRQK